MVPEEYLVAIGLGVLLTANYLHLAGLYSFAGLHRFVVQFGTLTASWAAVIATLLLIAYFGKVSGSFSRVWTTGWFASAFIGLVFVRGLTTLLLDRMGRTGRFRFNVVVVGGGEFGQRLVRHLDQQRDHGIHVLGVFDDRRTRIPDAIEGHPVIGTLDGLLAFLRGHRVDQVIIALPWSAEERIAGIVEELRSVPVDVTLCPGEAAFELPNMGFSSVGGVPMLTVTKPPISGWDRVVKGTEDMILASLILLATWPVLLLIALAVRMSGPGPILYRQRRFGFNNNEFTLFKFRTMRWRPDEDDADRQAQRNDPRVTTIGRLLRRTSLDELPQLFNVLRGEMSLVGPRPHTVAHNRHYAAMIDKYLARHKVKPGITGWAQVNGLRGEIRVPEMMRRRVQHDLYYIENWSLIFDFKIMLLTLFTGFVHENAY